MNNTLFNIREVDSRLDWNNFVTTTTNDTFHQSWEWGQTYVHQNGRVWYLGLYKEDVLVGACLTIYIKARRGSFLLIPHGPLLSPHILENDALFLAAVEKYTHRLIECARTLGCVCIRMAPTFEQNTRSTTTFRHIGYHNAPIFVQSELSWRLNIAKPEESLLAGMRKSTRYILKRSSLYNVSFSCSKDIEDFEGFYSLYKTTVKTKEFIGQSGQFIKEEFRSFGEFGHARFYFALRGGQPLAAAMIITFGKTGYYHYGASVKDDNNTPAPHLLQWHIIRDLKREGFEFYNFWGISPDDKPLHPWHGLTLFKKGFGGEALPFLKTQDYILSWWSWPSWILETLRRIKRHY